jgi:transposase
LIAEWKDSLSEEDGVNLAALHDYLVEEHSYPGSRRSVQRYYRAHFPRSPRRARRRVETPAGAQAQVDWADFPEVIVAGRRRYLHAFHMELSHSRYDAVVWSESKDELSWLHAHNESFRRLEGIPAVVRIDNEKTAVVKGAGAWGEIHPGYRRYASALRFHVDPCPPYSPNYKGKVERRIRDQRLRADPARRVWSSLEQLQEWTDERMCLSASRRRCPITGDSVHSTWLEEKRLLQPLPLLPEPFDIAVQRSVGVDCMVAFEGRSYSVPFRFVGRRIEVRGCHAKVQFLIDGQVVAIHPRSTPERLLIDPAHFEGPATDDVLPPPPLGRMGRRLMEIAALTPQTRPMDLYVALAEVAR